MSSTISARLQGGPEWLHSWDPENEDTWDRRLAWQTLWITTFTLTLCFVAWFLPSAIVPKLNAIGYDFIGLQQDSSLHGLLQRTAHQLGRPLRMRIQVRSFEAISRMIQTGMGVGVLPEAAVRDLLPALDVAVIPLTDPWARRELKVGVRSLERLSVTARQMLEHLLADAPGSSRAAALADDRGQSAR